LIKGTSTCRCTKFEIVKTDLQPGESTEVNIDWHASSVPIGPFRQSATINTNDPARPQILFTIHGDVTYSFRLVPDTIVLTGVPVNQERTGEARIYSYRPSQLEVTSHEFTDAATADRFDVHIQPLAEAQVKEEKNAQSGVLVSATVKPGLPVGSFRQKIQLKLNLADEPKVDLGIEGTIVSDVLLVGRGWDGDHGLLSFPTVNRTDGAKADLFILAQGDHRKEVRPKVQQVSPEFLKVTVGEPVELPGGTQVRIPLTVEIPRDLPPQAHMGGVEGKLGEIVLSTGHPEAKELKLRVRFTIVE
jgi:hypothetical protein